MNSESELKNEVTTLRNLLKELLQKVFSLEYEIEALKKRSHGNNG